MLIKTKTGQIKTLFQQMLSGDKVVNSGYNSVCGETLTSNGITSAV